MKGINRRLQHSVGVAAKGIGTAVEYRCEDLLLAHRMRQDQRVQSPPGPAGGIVPTAFLNLLQGLEGGGGIALDAGPGDCQQHRSIGEVEENRYRPTPGIPRLSTLAIPRHQVSRMSSISNEPTGVSWVLVLTARMRRPSSG